MTSVNTNSSSTSSSTSTTVPTMVNPIAHINPSLLLLSNMSSMVTVKLDFSNYIVWKHLIEIRDRLAAVSVVLDDEDLLHIALDGLPLEFDSFSSAIRTRSDVISIEELNTLLNAEERAIKKRSGLVDTTSMAMAVNNQSQGFHRGRGRHSNQRGRGGGGRGNFSGGSSNGPFNPTLPLFNQPQSSQAKSLGFQQGF
ncbi:hypothetical protein SO802_005106 [Lithocarpus litseifolius]|uniref:Retrotransposon Copia-like N-terminal domain-containing protein n=1 Tax=Lithocarpus litseifolius TaxID=425828 RepID=A0AAW2DK96_9ROSI